MHTLLDLRGNIPSFIHISDGKYHDSNVLDIMDFQNGIIYLMDKAYVDFEALMRINNAGAFFVTRAKSSIKYNVVEQNHNIDETTGLRADKNIVLTVLKSKKLYPEKLRLVEFYDNKNDELLVFLTKNFEVSSLEVAYLYQNRWQIEVFFKWIKQNLIIKKFWGHTPNAVKIHLWSAICTCTIVAYIKHSFDKTPMAELLTDSQSSQNVKELQYELFLNNS